MLFNFFFVSSFFCLFFGSLWQCHAACRILVPRRKIEPMPPSVETQSPDHWTAREVSLCVLNGKNSSRWEWTSPRHHVVLVWFLASHQVPSTRSPFLGLVWRVDLFWREGVSTIKEEWWEKPPYRFNYRLLNPYCVPSVSSKVWDGICMSGMCTCAVTCVQRTLCSAHHVLEIPLVSWSSLLPNPLLPASPNPCLSPVLPQPMVALFVYRSQIPESHPRFFFPWVPTFYQPSSYIHPSFL